MRVADRDHELADAKRCRVAELGRRQVARVGAQHREVGERVGADDGEVELPAVDERRPPPGPAAADDVGGGEHEAVGRDHDRASSAVEDTTSADAARDA